MKDLLILGAGPAGLSAAIYAVRAGIDCAVLEKLSPGGQVITTYMVENYPGFPEPVPGWDLMSKMEDQARRLGVSIESGEAASLRKDQNTDYYTVELAGGGELQARSVIAATGASFRRLGVPGEEEFLGRGVSVCATCDGPFFKDRDVAVVGGGDVALEEAHFLTRFARRVYLIHRRNEFRGARILQDRTLSSDRVEPVLSSVVNSIDGGMKVEGVTVKDVASGKESTIDVDGVFIFIGYDPNTGYLPAEVLNDRNEIIVDMEMKTPVAGLFAAGDLRSGSKKQIVMAAADGATAALGAYEYLSDSCWGM